MTETTKMDVLHSQLYDLLCRKTTEHRLAWNQLRAREYGVIIDNAWITIKEGNLKQVNIRVADFKGHPVADFWDTGKVLLGLVDAYWQNREVELGSLLSKLTEL